MAQSTSSWLKSKKGDSSDSDTEKSPSIRRNNISLEDSNDKKESGHILGSSSSSTNDESVKNAGVAYLNKKKMLKRRLSPVENNSIKKFFVTENDKKNKEAENADASSHSETCVQCPICNMYYEAEEIEDHSATCDTFIKDDVECPVCNKLMSAAVIDIHAIKCATDMFGD
ncbi:hypothetical protein L9F63_001180 [Diploptera punctata]|uniref:Uncharacterized protein n=1 Tax=Diploptera punctata TaxID=6984 RepID=A0AAD8A4F4_DIPPU|nr:hypothetical protein L9F63_001180 [Diploptera punctata]